MALNKTEMREWKRIYAKSKRHKIPVRRIKGTANVSFGKNVYAQLGTGRATSIMNARVSLKKKRGKR